MQNDERWRSIKQKPQAHKRSRLCFLQGEYVHRPQLFIRQFLRQLFKFCNQYFPFVLHSFFPSLLTVRVYRFFLSQLKAWVILLGHRQGTKVSCHARAVTYPHD